MNFADMKSIKIPEGDVIKITVNGVVIWGATDTAVLGKAILGLMVLGRGRSANQLARPTIRLVTQDQLAAPEIYLSDMDQLGTPEIYLSSVEQLETPVIRLETQEQLATPVIYLYSNQLATPMIYLEEV